VIAPTGRRNCSKVEVEVVGFVGDILVMSKAEYGMEKKTNSARQSIYCDDGI
jgi:hypothetical protein